MVTDTRDAAHEELNEELNAYLDDQLDAARRAEVERHLAACGVCQADLEDLRVTRAVLREQPLLRAPRPFVLPAEPEPARGAWWAALLPWSWRLGSLATALCLILALTNAWSGPVRMSGGGAAAGSAAMSKAAPSAAQPERAESRDQFSGGAPAAPPAPAQQAVPAQAQAPASQARNTDTAATSGAAAGAAPPQSQLQSAPQAPQATPPAGSPARAPAAGASEARDAESPARRSWGLAPWLPWALAAALGLGSAGLFALDRRVRDG